ncbi:diguanylate cyclase [Paludibacterium paludis]|uniref:PAS domain S-box-containing protein/diguanylate cyclase (GGDEF)-like protein n=1 Tax=Paludibacterium paludis TaxID=1225769 RepID=A0A918U881_9NEIS|nr:diguanylate cyclase [Paludibacterium paludis]GGY08695.1 hypothetical protein GCM10011289_09350 [Paludibacterium paludis]
MLASRFGRTLKFRVALLTVVLGMGSLVLIGWFNFQAARAEIKNERFRYLSDLVERIAADIDQRVAVRQRLLASSVRTLHPTDAALPQMAEGILTSLRPIAPLFDALVVYDRHGIILADEPASAGRRGLDIHDRDYFIETRKSLRPMISVPLRTRNNPKRRIVVFTVPLTDPHGQFVGMVGGSLELLSVGFFRDLESITIGNSGYITVNAVRSRLNIYHPDTSRVFEPLPSAASSPALNRALGGWQGVDETTISTGERMLVAYRPLRQVDWVVGGLLPVGEAYEPIYSLAERYIAFALGMMLVVLLLVSWRLKHILRPLDRLKSNILTLPASGNSVLAGISDYDELQSVADVVARAWSERDTMEAQLARSEAFFRALNEASPLGVFVVDDRGKLNYVNRACKRLFGYENEVEWHGRHWNEAVHPLDHERIRALARSLLADGETLVKTECRLINGQRPFLNVELRLCRLTYEAEPRFLGVVMDVSEQEETRQSLMAERERAMAILESIGDAVVLTSHLDEIEYLNQPAEALLGVRAQDTLGRPLYSFASFSPPENGRPLSIQRLESLVAHPFCEMDMMTKDARVQPVVLTLSVIAAVGSMHGYRVYVLHDDSARREREKAHRWEANHDPLTGLLNRRGYLASLSGLLAGPDRKGRNDAIALIDLDHFKAVNDHAGHGAGDQLLQDVAGIIQSRLRSSDVAARLGGDEFALLLFNCRLDDARALIEAVRGQIEAHVLEVAGVSLSVTASVGMTMLRPDDVVPADPIERADQRCYLAKNAGRNRLVTG